MTIPTFTPERAPRAIYIFTVPAALASEIGVSSIGIVELTASEELLAVRKANGDPHAAALGMAMESIREADGKPLATHDGSADAWWEKAHPKARQLALNAYQRVHTVKNEEVGDFFKSVKVSTI